MSSANQFQRSSSPSTPPQSPPAAHCSSSIPTVRRRGRPPKQHKKTLTLTAERKRDKAAASRKRFLQKSLTSSTHNTPAKTQQPKPNAKTYNLASSLTKFEKSLEHKLGLFDQVCPQCSAIHFRGEKVNNHFSFCCKNGKVVLDASRTTKVFPDYLQHLMTSLDDDAKHFQNNIRQYNSSLAFASLKVEMGEMPKNSTGPYVFKIHGQIYNRISALHPPEQLPPAFSQLYIMDADEALAERLKQPSAAECKKPIMEKLDNILRQCNPYARVYKTVGEVEKRERELASEQNRPVQDVRMVFSQIGPKGRTRNEPVAGEIASIFVGEHGEPPLNIDFTIFSKTNKLINLSSTSPHAEPMTYPLIYPYGEKGWGLYMQHDPKKASKTRSRITMLQFYAYRLAVRAKFSALHHAGKLFLQWCVDSYVKQEGNNLKYLRFHQHDLRVEEYDSLFHHVHSQPDKYTPGKVFILPSSFIGSPRHQQQCYQDSMAIVRIYGLPDLFITFTCNPKWPEIIDITKNFPTHLRPDLIARVFRLKLKELLDDIYVKHVLGVPVAGVYVIEFQKRGLPHAHILVILRKEDKLRDAAAINKLICAEIPDPVEEPYLHEVVKRHMIHGPCGALNPKCQCMVNGECSKKFPKDFLAETVENVDGYPRYRRRDNGIVINYGSIIADSRFVVPYSPFLSAKYDAHINVECCSSIKSVKYLHKYIYKGHDCATIEIRKTATQEEGTDKPVLNWDEITRYLDARYVSAPEAVWRLFEFPMGDMTHTVIRLAVHLPAKQPVIFSPGQERQALNNAKKSLTTLTAFFALNKKCSEARRLLYQELPTYYTFNKQTGWQVRERGSEKSISRMYFVNPKERDRYFVRLLLLHVKGATSFEHLKTYNNVRYGTFQEAAEARGLLASDDEWHRCLDEAKLHELPRQLRFLFAIICVFCHPTNPLALFEKFERDLCEDFVYKQYSALQARNACLADIEETFVVNNMHCSSFGLPTPVLVNFIQDDRVFDVEEEKRLGAQKMSLLNSDQQQIAQIILNAVDNPCSNRAFFVDGPGGTGKTFLYSALLHTIRGRGKIALAVAFSGIAATLLPGGRTVHSRFKLPVPLNETSTSCLKLNSAQAQIIREADLLLWDEAPMAPSSAFMAVNRILQDIMGNNYLFGGKSFLAGGDHRQILPVVPHGNRTSIVNSCVKRSPLWPQIQQLALTKNMRAESSETLFADWLIQLGNGSLPVLEGTNDVIELPPQCCIKTPIEDFVFGPTLNHINPENYCSKAILCPLNEDCFILNDKILQKLPGEITTYTSCDSVICDDEEEAANYPDEFIHTLTPSGMPQHILNLKEGAVIILLRNLNPKRGLCNGTRMIVRRCQKYCLDCEIVTGPAKASRVFIPRIELAPSDTNYPFILKRRQFPIRLAFAMTINKAQGQTFDTAGLYLPEPVFTHGQLYVAFSRVKRFEDIKVQVLNTVTQGLRDDRTYTSNVVFKEVF